jgi:hypothetical protein
MTTFVLVKELFCPMCDLYKFFDIPVITITFTYLDTHHAQMYFMGNHSSH